MQLMVLQLFKTKLLSSMVGRDDLAKRLAGFLSVNVASEIPEDIKIRKNILEFCLGKNIILCEVYSALVKKSPLEARFVEEQVAEYLFSESPVRSAWNVISRFSYRNRAKFFRKFLSIFESEFKKGVSIFGSHL
jgi:hypothetical protein